MKYQKIAGEMSDKCGFERDPMIRYADVMSELGELGKELLLGNNYGTKPMEPAENLAKELGDVVFALALLANSVGLDLDECFDVTMEKYNRRYENTGQTGSRG
jgi:NTP pyrophosphatase (non-canonical NTP hydrolase)